MEKSQTFHHRMLLFISAILQSCYLCPDLTIMISVNKLSVQFSGNLLFDEVTFVIADKDRVGLVGKNGAGKTTLMRIIKGLQEPESGDIVIPADTTIGFLPQEMNIQSTGKSVMEETLTAFSDVINLDFQIKDATAEIASRTDYESEQYHKLISRITELNERFQLLGGGNIQGDTERVLQGLGFTPADFDKKISQFSGGWQMRVELAKILLQRPNIMLLDEPTNHLDIESIQWLEEFLQNYQGAVVMVSHDRMFLDKVTQRTIEISLGKIFDYKASYTRYESMRRERIEHQMAAYNNQQKLITDSEKFISRFRYQATKAKQVQSRIKLLDKIERIEVDETDNSSIYFRFPPAPHAGKVMAEAENLSKHYGEKHVLDNVSFMINNGDRVAFVGKNGMGKTTLSRIIAGELDYTGIFKFGHQVKLGYYAQNQSDLLDMEKTVFQTIDHAAVGEIRTKMRAILGSFLFGEEDLDKKVKVLSGGEKSRLAIARLLLSPVNLLLLDEPTNHLDMRSKDILKQALMKYDGTIIIVSHDRDFLHGITNRVFEFRNHRIYEHLGDIYEFLESRKLSHLKELEAITKTKTAKGKTQSTSGALAEREAKKNAERESRQLNKQIQHAEAEIDRLEKEISDAEEKLINPETYKTVLADKDFYNSYEQAKKMLEIEMQKWEKLNKKLSEFS